MAAHELPGYPIITADTSPDLLSVNLSIIHYLLAVSNSHLIQRSYVYTSSRLGAFQSPREASNQGA
jgi:hypothetical protein